MDSDRKTPTTTLVFIPFPVMSHQEATIQMASLLVARDPRLSATVIVMKMPHHPADDTNINNNNNNIPAGINIVELPQDDFNLAKWGQSPHSFVTHFVPSQKAAVRAAVGELTATIAGFVVDMFCTSMMDVAGELGVPSYVFFTCGAATLGLLFHLQALTDDDDLAAVYGMDSDKAVAVPTYEVPVPAKVWPSIVFETDSAFPDFVRKFREAKGVVVNTFLELEPHAIRALSADKSLPPVYPVGPIIHDATTGSMIVEWLDGRADSSVVFVCFGSNGSFERDQVEAPPTNFRLGVYPLRLVAGGVEKEFPEFL